MKLRACYLIVAVSCAAGSGESQCNTLDSHSLMQSPPLPLSESTSHKEEALFSIDTAVDADVSPSQLKAQQKRARARARLAAEANRRKREQSAAEENRRKRGQSSAEEKREPRAAQAQKSAKAAAEAKAAELERGATSAELEKGAHHARRQGFHPPEFDTEGINSFFHAGTVREPQAHGGEASLLATDAAAAADISPSQLAAQKARAQKVAQVAAEENRRKREQKAAEAERLAMEKTRQKMAELKRSAGHHAPPQHREAERGTSTGHQRAELRVPEMNTDAVNSFFHQAADHAADAGNQK